MEQSNIFITDEGSVKVADKFISFGNDMKYFAVCEGALFIKSGEYYRLIQKDFRDEGKH